MTEWQKERLDEYVYHKYGKYAIIDFEPDYDLIYRSPEFQLYCLRCAKKELKEAMAEEFKPVIDKLERMVGGLMEKLKRYTEDDGSDWCRAEDVDRLESELELALSCLNEDQLDEMERRREG